MKATTIQRVAWAPFMSVVVLAAAWMLSTTAVAQGPFPTFAAHLPSSQVHVYGWPAGAALTLTIDDPDIPGTPDFEAGMIVPNNSDINGATWALFALSGFQLRPGQVMTITDGTTTKTHVVKAVTVTFVDPSTDVISGTAQPNTIVGINAHYEVVGPASAVERSVVADQSGHWTVDLSKLGSGENETVLYYVLTESWGTAHQVDDDGDDTYYAWKGSDADGDGKDDDDDICPNENAFAHDADENGCVDTASGLATLLENMPAETIAPNIKKALMASVTSAIRSLDSGHAVVAVKQIKALISLLEAQRGKAISKTAADLLIAYAINVIAGAQ